MHPPQMLWEWLALRDPQRARALDPADGYRILRALEIALAPAERSPDGAGSRTLRTAGIPFFKAVLDVPMETIDARIERRADEMLARGLLDEAERIGAERGRGRCGRLSASARVSARMEHCAGAAYSRSCARRGVTRGASVRGSRPNPTRIWIDPGSLDARAREKLGWT